MSGYAPIMGVRSHHRVVEQQICDKVTDDHLEAKHLLADLSDGELIMNKKEVVSTTISPVM